MRRLSPLFFPGNCALKKVFHYFIIIIKILSPLSPMTGETASVSRPLVESNSRLLNAPSSQQCDVVLQEVPVAVVFVRRNLCVQCIDVILRVIRIACTRHHLHNSVLVARSMCFTQSIHIGLMFSHIGLKNDSS